MDHATIRVAVYQDEGVWVAQCLNYDICAQAPDLGILQERFDATLAADLEESLKQTGVPFGGIAPPPENVRARFERTAASQFTRASHPTSGNNAVPSYEMALCA